jgi:hypothetical protein
MTIQDDNIAALTVQVNALLATITANQTALNTAVSNAQNAASAAAASAAQALTGIPVRTALAAVNLASRSLCYIRGDGQLALSDSNILGREAIAFVKLAYTAGQTATYYTAGNIISGLSGLVPNTEYFMSTVAGGFSTSSAAPTTSGVRMSIGRALSTTEILFYPQSPISL